MTFQGRYRFSSRSELALRFLQICTIIGFIEPWTTLANSTIPAFQQYNQPVQQIQNKNLSTFGNIDSSNAVKKNAININNTLQNNIYNDEEETTFLPETVLFQLSDRKLFNSLDKINNTKYNKRKKMLNATIYNAKPVEPLKINSSELPVEKNRTKLPEHKLSKNPTSINLESRMLFNRDKE